MATENGIGVGDAENDHAFLRLCGCAVAVSNALPSLKETADLVTQRSHGDGVAELIELLLLTNLRDVPLRQRPRAMLHEDPRVFPGLGPQPGQAP